MLKDLGKKLKAKKKEKEQSPKTKPERIVKGWSFPKIIPSKGPLPKCRGCGKKIGRNEPRIRHNYYEEKHHAHLSVHQFHVKYSCLADLKKQQLEEFLKKKWSQKEVERVQNMLKRMGTPETDSD